MTPAPPSQHPVCRACWVLTHLGHLPKAEAHAPARKCCFCDSLQCDGLTLDAPPEKMPCGGAHGAEGRR